MDLCWVQCCFRRPLEEHIATREAEGVIMKIGGWRTRSVFEQYAIVSQADIADAIGKLRSETGIVSGIVKTKRMRTLPQ